MTLLSGGRLLVRLAAAVSLFSPVASRLYFVSNDWKRLDAEVTATQERRTVHLTAGTGSQLEVVQLA